MFTQEEQQNLVEAIGGNTRAIVEESKRDILSTVEGSTRAIVEESKRDILSTVEGSTRAIVEESGQNLLSAIQAGLTSVRDDIQDNAEAIAMLADHVEDHRKETRRSFMQLRSYFDRQHLDLEDRVFSATRNEDRKVNRIVEKLREKRVFTVADQDDVFAMPVYPSSMLP